MIDKYVFENPINFLFNKLMNLKSYHFNSQSMAYQKVISENLLQIIATSNISRNLIISNK